MGRTTDLHAAVNGALVPARVTIDSGFATSLRGGAPLYWESTGTGTPVLLIHGLGLSGGAVRELLGGSPTTVPDRFAATDPATLGAPAAAVVVVHGLLDDTVPVEAARSYCDRTGAALVEVPGTAHFELIDPASEAWPVILAALRDVLG